MECTLRRTLSSVIILIVSMKVVCCQNVLQAGHAPLLCVSTNSAPPTPSNNLMNALYNLAASNDARPDLRPLFETTSASNDFSRKPLPLKEYIGQPVPFEYSGTPTCPQGNALSSVFPVPQEAFNVNVSPPPLTNPSPEFTAPIIPRYTVFSPSLVSQSPAFTVPQPMSFGPATPFLQSQAISNNPPELTTRSCPTKVEVTPASKLDKCSDAVEFTIPTVINENGCLPISLQINLPAPIIPEPNIIVVAPAPSETIGDEGSPAFPPYQTPPVIIQRSRSKSRNWLPILLIALFDGDRCGGGGMDCGCCCCPCKSGSKTPIPYPIPVPTNNPIIFTD